MRLPGLLCKEVVDEIRRIAFSGLRMAQSGMRPCVHLLQRVMTAIHARSRAKKFQVATLLISRQRFGRFVFAATLAVAGVMTGAAQAGTSRPPDTAGAIGVQPLTQDDIALYLKVMRDAAQRLRNLSPADRKIIADYQALASGESGQQQVTNQSSEAASAQRQQSERALRLMTAMDEIVAADEHVDIERYHAIKDRIEAAISPADCNACSDSDSADPDSDSADSDSHDEPPDPGQKREADRVTTVADADARTLAPYRMEIQALLRAVREYQQLPPAP